MDGDNDVNKDTDEDEGYADNNGDGGEPGVEKGQGRLVLEM